MRRLSPEARSRRRLERLAYGRVRYQRIKALGLCVRCQEPAVDGLTFCSEHRRHGNAIARSSARRRLGCVPHDPEHPQFGYLDRVQTGRQKRPDPASHFRRRYTLPACCPRCRSNVFKVLFNGEPGVRCPSCGYVADQQMLWNLARVQRAKGAV